MSLVRKKGNPKIVREIPVLCKIWEEDGVFNGVAEHLPVAVFGKTHEEAVNNLMDAIIAHLEALQELHKLDAAIENLRSQARDSCFSYQELPRGESLVRLSAAFHNSQVLALV